MKHSLTKQRLFMILSENALSRCWNSCWILRTNPGNSALCFSQPSKASCGRRKDTAGIHHGYSIVIEGPLHRRFETYMHQSVHVSINRSFSMVIMMSTRLFVSVSRRSIAALSYKVSAFHSYSCGNSAIAFRSASTFSLQPLSDPTRVFPVKKSNSMHISAVSI